MKFTLILAYLLMLFTHGAQAYYSSLETGEVLAEGQYRATAETQLLTDNTTGVNFVGRFDTWLSEEMNFQGLLGFGEVDTQVGGFVKWVPFPDFDQQPAIGFKMGALYARIADQNELSARFTPFVSKSFQSEIGTFIPFASLPTGIRTVSGEIDLPIQIAAGTEWKTPELEKLSFLFEVGVDINDAFSYISLAVSLQMDDDRGIVIE